MIYPILEVSCSKVIYMYASVERSNGPGFLLTGSISVKYSGPMHRTRKLKALIINFTCLRLPAVQPPDKFVLFASLRAKSLEIMEW